jgi:GR25 family glycosyltransferase involved in LPS biosynthesis
LLNREELCKSGYIADNLSYGDGTLGCAMSHIYLWEKIAAGNIPMTIFEDDAILSYRFEQVSCNILNRLPMDWDIIHWGNIISPSFIWVDLGHTSARIEPYGPARNTDYGPARNTDNEQQLQIFSGRILTPQP